MLGKPSLDLVKAVNPELPRNSLARKAVVGTQNLLVDIMSSLTFLMELLVGSVLIYEGIRSPGSQLIAGQ